MHKMAAHPITLDCFEIDDLQNFIPIEKDSMSIVNHVDNFINFLEALRIKYIETQDVRFWKELIRWLPSSWLQTRTVTMSYENLLAMCGKGQRRFHKLTEWRISFINWARTLPYAQELIFLDELQRTKQEKIDEMLEHLGIKILDEMGDHTSFGDIFIELGKILPTLDKIEQDKIVNLILK